MKAPSKSRLLDATSERLRLLMKEVGSPPLTSGGADAFDETIVIAQLPGESPTVFAQRVIRRFAAVERSGRYFHSATVQAGARHDAEARAARRQIILALARRSHVPGRMSEVLLQADSRAEAQARQELLSLVDELLALPPGKPAPVRLRFEKAEEPVSEPNSRTILSAPIEVS